MRKLLFCLPLLLISCQPAFALESPPNGVTAQISDSKAVKCVLGEYESGTLEDMTATAEALRNRMVLMGSSRALRGVYGCKAVSESVDIFKRGRRVIPDYAVKRAYKAWEASRTSNLTLGASFWESTDFKEPYWAKSMVKTAKIGRHQFYKYS